MNEQNHPITPPPEMMAQWSEIWHKAGAKHVSHVEFVATKAARWGADQELDACCEHLKRIWAPSDTIDSLRLARRPKPPNFKEQALKMLADVERCTEGDFFIIRRALEQLDD